jgi:hypothetical protein
MQTAAVVALSALIAGCVNITALRTPPPPLPEFCRVGPGGARAPLNPEQQRACTFHGYTPGGEGMFSPWGRGGAQDVLSPAARGALGIP